MIVNTMVWLKEIRWSCLKWGSTNVLTFSESNHQDALFETKLVFCFYSLANFRGLEHRFGNVPYLIMVHLPNFFRWQRNYCFKNLVKKNSKPTMQFWLFKRLVRNKKFSIRIWQFVDPLNVMTRMKFNNSLSIYHIFSSYFCWKCFMSD